MKLQVCCAVIIDASDKILVCRRKVDAERGGKWEFPGGKIEQGESREGCLEREILEELGVEIKVGSALKEVYHAYSDKEIVLYPFICKIVGHKNISLYGHDSVKWIETKELLELDWSEADLGVVSQLFGA